MTSPKLNNLIGIGAIVLYVNMILYAIPTTSQTASSVLCNVLSHLSFIKSCIHVQLFLQLDPWLNAIGYSLCYGTILAKMCRVYYIFHNPGIKKKVHVTSGNGWFLIKSTDSCKPLNQITDRAILIAACSESSLLSDPVKISCTTLHRS